MNKVFADTQYWVAYINQNDQWHERALEAEANLIEPFFVTTDAVLIEVLTFFGEHGAIMRVKAAAAVEIILQDENTEVLPLSHEDFLQGLEFYKARPDKGYSLIDCISMNVMRDCKISEILTHDHHFEQEGFIVLL